MNDGLFERALGAQYMQLHPALQRFHRLRGRHELHGEVEVFRPATRLGRFVGWMLGSPLHNARGPIRFELHAAPGAEHWVRHFPGRTLQSRLRWQQERLQERMGPVRLHMEAVACDQRLELRLLGMHVLGWAAPRWLVPTIKAVETGAEGRIHFDVAASYPWAGQVVGYRGWLALPRLGENAAP